jgi:hypothetical protein
MELLTVVGARLPLYGDGHAAEAIVARLAS